MERLESWAQRPVELRCLRSPGGSLTPLFGSSVQLTLMLPHPVAVPADIHDVAVVPLHGANDPRSLRGARDRVEFFDFGSATAWMVGEVAHAPHEGPRDGLGRQTQLQLREVRQTESVPEPALPRDGTTSSPLGEDAAQVLDVRPGRVVGLGSGYPGAVEPAGRHLDPDQFVLVEVVLEAEEVKHLVGRWLPRRGCWRRSMQSNAGAGRTFGCSSSYRSKGGLTSGSRRRPTHRCHR